MTKHFTCLVTVLSVSLMLTGCGDSKPSGASIKSGTVDPAISQPAKIGAPGGGGGATSKPKGVD
jgi:hypothetical protein